MIGLKEALVRKNRNNNVQELVYSEVIDFLKQNYKFKFPHEYKNEIEKYIKFQDGIIDVLCDIEVSNKTITSLSNNLFKFNTITGNFDCRGCNNLTSLEGAPKEVKGYFNCNRCNNLTSLEGAPKEVKKYFNCSRCNNLISLEGAPKEVNEYFDCGDCEKLESLEGAPKEVKGAFYCDFCKKLKSLEGAPKVIKGRFIHDKI